MASIYRRPGSKFWWIKFRDERGLVHRESTRIEAGSTFGLRKAQELCARKSVDEDHAPQIHAESAWDHWVEDYIAARHGSMPNTLKRNLTTWATLRAYLREVGVDGPVALTRTHCLGYVAWRQRHPHVNARRVKGKGVSINTIILELKTLSKLLHEAIDRGHITSNPCARLGIKRAAPRVKSEMSDEQIEFVRGELAKLTHDDKEAMQIAFEIAAHQGLRMTETNLDLRHVDLNHMEAVVRAKGDKHYTIPIHPNLKPLLERLIKQGRQTAYQMPEMFQLRWFKFFNRLRASRPDFRTISFHSLRVSVISRLHRGEVPERLAMRLVNHASTTVHRVYVRVRGTEMHGVWNRMGIPESSQTQGSPQSTSARGKPSSAGRD